MAVCTAGDGFGVVELGTDDGFVTALYQTQQTLAGQLLTGAYTLVTQNALALIPLDGNKLLLHKAGVLAAAQTVGVDGLLVGISNQTAVIVIVTATLQLCQFLPTQTGS